jgi:hypothetical protein
MKITEYQTIIGKTAQYPETVHGFGLSYAGWGLIGENDEYLHELDIIQWGPKDTSPDAFIKEAGDLCWYITLMSTILHLNITDIFEGECTKDEYIPLDKMAEPIKKHYRDSKPIDTNLFTEILKGLVCKMREDIDFINASSTHNISMENILKVNYEKLLKRRENNTIKGDGSNR